MTKQHELSGAEDAALYSLAEQILDNPDQMARYNEAMWNFVGDPDPNERRQGRMPELTRRDGQGVLRAYTHDVFSGFSPDGKILTIRKDPLGNPDDPASWLAVETSLATGEVLEYPLHSAHVDGARGLWLQVRPYQGWNMPERPAFHGMPRSDQTRFSGRLDERWQTSEVEYKEGLRHKAIVFEDSVALASMIGTVEAVRAAQAEAAAGHEQEPVDVRLAA